MQSWGLYTSSSPWAPWRGCSVTCWPVPSGINIVSGKMRKQISAVSRVTCRGRAETQIRVTGSRSDTAAARHWPNINKHGPGHTCHVSHVCMQRGSWLWPGAIAHHSSAQSSLHFLAEQRGQLAAVVVGRLQTELFMLIKLYYISQSYYTPNVNSILLIDMKIEDMRR